MINTFRFPLASHYELVFNTLYALQINVIILKFSEAFDMRGCT